MKNFLLALLAWALSLYICAADLPPINIEKEADFKLNNNYLYQGNIQYYSGHYEGKNFTKLPPEIVALDEHNAYKIKGSHLLVYRYAYTLPIRPGYIFDNRLYAEQDFILANHGNVSQVSFPDEENPLEQIFTFREIKGKKGTTVYRIEHKEVKSPAARIMKSQTINPDDGLLINATTMTYYYPLGDVTLVVVCKFAALKPSLKLKIGFGTGLAQHFLKEEENDLVKSVKQTRLYLNGLMKK